MPASRTSRDLARRVLDCLEQRQLDSTPEHFARVYAELSAADGVAESAPERVEWLRQLDEVLGTAEPDVESPLTPMVLAGFMRRMTQLTVKLHDTIRASQQDLADVKNGMRSMHDELERTCNAIERDPLTGCLNRVGLDHLLSREVSRARRHGSILCAVLFDLDKFKAVNDLYGHTAGDQVLIHITSLCRSVLRDSDYLVRYGGDEFLILLPETDAAGAARLVDRLQLSCAATPYMHDTLSIPMTISAGITELMDEQNGHALLLRADVALYAAKAAGRNTWSLHD